MRVIISGFTDTVKLECGHTAFAPKKPETKRVHCILCMPEERRLDWIWAR